MDYIAIHQMNLYREGCTCHVPQVQGGGGQKLHLKGAGDLNLTSS